MGGDFYDVIALGDDCLGLVTADVWGKGMPAALFMALTHSLVQTEAQRCARSEQFDDLALLVSHLRSHCRLKPDEMRCSSLVRDRTAADRSLCSCCRSVTGSKHGLKTLVQP